MLKVAEVVVCGGDGGESADPTTNFPRIPVDTNRSHYLVKKSGLGVDPRSLIEQGESRHVGGSARVARIVWDIEAGLTDLNRQRFFGTVFW